jgi:hypothetical protein
VTPIGTTLATIAVFAVALECPRPPTEIILGPIRPTGPCDPRSAPSVSKIEAKDLPPPSDLRLHSGARVLHNEPRD